jgi:septal ring factor EnvC (AmiA/AmiB activator)
MSEFKSIETQEELDRIIQDRLSRQKESIEKQYADYETLKAEKQELETKAAALQATIEETSNSAKTHEQTLADLNAKIAGYETANLRTRIALQSGLPFDLADRLVGTDEDSIKADAERLALFVKPKATVAPLKNTESKLGDDKNSNWRQMASQLTGEGE